MNRSTRANSPPDAKDHAAAYFALQGAAVAAWWIALWLRPQWRVPFLPRDFPGDTLLAFAPADALLLVAGSWLLAAAIRHGSSWTIPLAWLVAGALDYAALITLAQSSLTGSGWLAFVSMAPAALVTTALALRLTEGAVPLLRTARAATRARNLAKTIVQIVVFWSLFLGLIPAALIEIEARLGIDRFTFPGRVPIAVAAFAMLSTIGLWSATSMTSEGEGTPLPLDSARKLVTSGPYAYVRNPMAIAGLGQGVVVGIGLGSWSTIAYALLGSAIWNYVVRPAEEADLSLRFGADFEHYRSRVRCWIPRRSAYRDCLPRRE